MVLTIAYRAAGGKRAMTSEQGAAADMTPFYPAAAPVAQAKLPPGGRVISATPWGERLILVVEDFGGTSVLVLDPKTAKIEPLARLTSP